MSSLIVKESGNAKFSPLEAGTYPGICCAIVDIGNQYSKAFDNERHQVILMFEIPSETIEFEGQIQSRTISGTYTMSLSDKSNLRKMLESWRSKAFTPEELQGFDLEKVLGLPCMVNVVSDVATNGNSYSKIGSVSKLPKGFPVQQGREEPFLFELINDKSIIHMQSLPDWIQNRIRESSTYKNIVGTGENGNETESSDVSEDDLPF